MNEMTIDELTKVVSDTTRIWAHSHKWDTSPREYEVEFVGVCEICRDRFDEAVERGEHCLKHPFSYFEKATADHPRYCEGCEGIDTGKRAAQNAQWEAER